MDALVAVEIMGYRRCDHPHEQTVDGHCWVVDGRHNSFLQYFSTQIGSAWDVLEKIRPGSMFISVDAQPNYYEVVIYLPHKDDGPVSTTSSISARSEDSPAHAICLAALKFKGVEV